MRTSPRSRLALFVCSISACISARRLTTGSSERVGARQQTVSSHWQGPWSNLGHQLQACGLDWGRRQFLAQKPDAIVQRKSGAGIELIVMGDLMGCGAVRLVRAAPIRFGTQA